MYVSKFDSFWGNTCSVFCTYTADLYSFITLLYDLFSCVFHFLYFCSKRCPLRYILFLTLHVLCRSRKVRGSTSPRNSFLLTDCLVLQSVHVTLVPCLLLILYARFVTYVPKTYIHTYVQTHNTCTCVAYAHTQRVINILFHGNIAFCYSSPRQGGYSYAYRLRGDLSHLCNSSRNV